MFRLIALIAVILVIAFTWWASKQLGKKESSDKY